MVKVIASSVRKGNVLEVDGHLCSVLSAESFFPGKGTPTTQIDMRRIADGVKVKVSATGKVRPKGGDHVLTTGGGFTGKTVTLVTDGAPDWLAHGTVRVNDDGDVVLYVIPDGTIIQFR